MTDEEWESLVARYLEEHTPLLVAEGEEVFVGYTGTRAWWEDDDE